MSTVYCSDRPRLNQYDGLRERVPCPIHGGEDPNVSIRVVDGRYQARCWSHNCNPHEILRALGQPTLSGVPAPQLNETKRIERAKEVWARTDPAHDSLVPLYLGVRGITIPVPSSLRYTERTRHQSGQIVPAMVAAIVREKEIIGVQRTFLVLDDAGRAALQPSKIIIGVVRGGCVRLGKAAETIAVCEGIETGLSIQQATGVSTWAALGAWNLGQVILPDIVKEVIIAADNDMNGVGQKAAYEAADRLIAQGRTVRIALPRYQGMDFNDYLRGEG